MRATRIRHAGGPPSIASPVGSPAAPVRDAPAALRALRPEAAGVTRRASRTFHVASLLLPREVRADVLALYLVLRTLDDAVDEADGPAAVRGADARIAAVEDWARGGRARTREANVLAVLDTRHDLPRESVLELCAGLRSDLDFRPPETVAELDRYCHRVAGTVGELMTAVLGTRGPRAEALPAARALGVAMQRTNVLRDVDEDLRERGRVYLPAELLERHGGGLDPRDPARASLVRELAGRAEDEYADGLAAIGLLAHGRPAVRAAALTYREILRELERAGWATDRRAVVPGPRRALLVGRALLGR